MTSMSRTGRPRMGSRSVHIPSHIPIASKEGKCRTASAHRIPIKGKGTGKGRKPLRNQINICSSDLRLGRFRGRLPPLPS